MKTQAKLFFHIALAGILCPGVGLPLVWSLALVARFAQPSADPEHMRWTRRLFALAALDTVLVVLLFAFVAPLKGGERTTLGGPVAVSSGPTRVIGVYFDTEDENGPARVEEVRPGYPAQAAGIQKGDVIVAVDGTDTPTRTEVKSRIDAEKADTVRLTIDRAGERKELAVGFATAKPDEARPLFQPESNTCPPLRHADVPWGLAIVAVSSAVLYAFGRRRGVNATLVWVALSLFAIAIVVEAVSYGTCRAIGGTSRGGFLVSLGVQTVLVLATGVGLSRRVPRLEKPADAPHWFAVAAVGALYMLTGGVRVGILLLVGKKVFGEAMHGSPLQSTELGGLATSGLGAGGTLLFIGIVAVLGPIGEEWLFRGVVLPWLAGWMQPGWAIAVSAALFAALHLYYGAFALMIFVYGLALGWVRMRSGVLRASMLLHVGLNSLATAVLVLGIKAG